MSQIKAEKFLQRVVTIRIDYRGKSLRVVPENATIFDEEPRPFSSRPLEVRWVVRGLEKEDTVRIQPKPGSSKRLFNPDNEGVFEITWPMNSICSGKPHEKKPDTKIDWFYDVEVVRDGETLFKIDPCIILQGGG